MVPKTRSDVTSEDSSTNFNREVKTPPASSSDTNHNDEDSSQYYYLTADARKELPLYQYRGADLSLLYHYVLSPLAASCVGFLPKSIAPNTITLFGLVWMVTAYGAYWYYVPTLEILQDPPPPQWIFLWNAIAMVAYQTLDNMDGKQARRTGSSSPLGLLFDHGCDAINSIFGSVNWIIGMGLVPRQNLWQCGALVFGPFGMFYIATWEQYYTGELIMPIINGPNEGLLGGVLLSLTSWYYGPSFWQGTEFSETLQRILPLFDFESLALRNCDFVIGAASLGFLQEMVLKTVVVTKKYSGSVTSLLPFAILLGCYATVAYVEPSLWWSFPRTCLHLATILFVEMSTELMLAHVTAQPFWASKRWPLLPLMGLTVGVVSASGRGSNEWIQQGMVATTWSLGLYLLVKIVMVIRESCATLEIWCFNIVTPPPCSKAFTKQD